MLLSKKWLNDYVDLKDIDVKDFCHKMTMTGSKVECFKIEGSEIDKVVVGKIISISKHPDADKLLVCKVDIGADNFLQVITAAHNIFEGAFVPVALHKSKIAGGVTIKKGKLRGLLSEGMFCSLAELNLTSNDFPNDVENGILIIKEECQLGQDIKEVLGINDTIIEFEITPNRPDCLSIIGLAREASAVFNKPLNFYNNMEVSKILMDKNIIDVDVKDKDLCKRYMVKMVKDVNIGPSPRWLRERLRSCGIRPINNIVDITNFVMLEYGQPIHAFDYDKISGHHIIVRKANKDEKINLLSGMEYDLDENILVVADEKKPLVIAGVMGGEESSISNDTKNVVFEIANFDPESVRKASKKMGLRTESSIRFEKGINNEYLPIVVNRICQLINNLEVGQVVDGIIDINNIDVDLKMINMDYSFINNLLGIKLDKKEIDDILKKLYIKVDENRAIIPSWRPDIIELADLAEEVGRIYGYDKIKPVFCNIAIPVAIRTDRQIFDNNVIDFMAMKGYYEIQTFSFISPKSYDKINLDKDDKLRDSVVIVNPLGEDTSVMRTTAIPSMLDVIAKNYNNQNLDGKFFEFTKEYFLNHDKNKLPNEKDSLIVGLYGKKSNFYDIKLDLEDLFGYLNIKKINFVAQKDNKIFHPGRCADMMIDNDYIGTLGQIHPVVINNYQLPTNVFVADLDVSKLFKYRIVDKIYRPISKFPSVARDLSLVCDESLPVSIIEDLIRQTIGTNLEDCFLSDVYKGAQVEKSKKSVCFSLKLRSFEKTLTDHDINIIINMVLDNLKKLNVYIREF